LMAQRNKAKTSLAKTVRRIEQLQLQVGDQLPMLASHNIDLTGLVQLTEASLGTENIVGTHLPTVSRITVKVKPYSVMATPHWVDNAVEALKEMLELKVVAQVNQRRLQLLNKAVSTITQRVNLFEKVLIPQAESNIKRIKVYLSDEQMAAVVRSKIAKRKRQSVVSE
jgi:V/A-type H+-transporting ATPase subunit D